MRGTLQPGAKVEYYTANYNKINQTAK